MVPSFIDGSGIMCFLDILRLSVYEGHEVWEMSILCREFVVQSELTYGSK